jgi:RNA-binding protein YhbY
MTSFIVAKFQIGKSGVTQGVIDSLLNVFKNHKVVRISTLKSSGRNRESIIEMAEELCKRLKASTGKRFLYKIIGFTIILKR